MKIKHIPNRINPYQYNEYGREPEFIVSEDKVNINCYISDYTQEDHTPTLIYYINNIEQHELDGDFQYRKENRDYYTFQLDNLTTGTAVTYAIKVLEDNNYIQTEWFTFEVLFKHTLKVPDQIYVSENNENNTTSLQCIYIIDREQKLNLRLDLLESNISIQMKCSNNIISNSVKLNQRFYEKSKEHYNIKINLNPFYLRIEDKMKNCLVDYREESHNIQILLTHDNKVQHFSITSDLLGNAFWGFGEKFDKVNQRGLKPKNCVHEQFTHQQEKTYLPIPYFITDKGYGFYYDTNYVVDFEIEEKHKDNNTLTISTVVGGNASESKANIFFGTIKDTMKQYINKVGDILLPPKWAFGPWMSGNGWDTQKETIEQVNNMKKYEIPATVIVLEAWSDEATFYIFNGAKYEPKSGGEALKYDDFTFEKDGKWSNPKEMSDIIHENNMKLILWQIPVIKHFDVHEVNQHENDEKTVLEKGYHVKMPDGSPYRITDNWFANSLILDFNNLEAVKWWFSKREYLVNELNVDGFKTDGGECVYDYRAIFADGKNGYEMKNQYPNSYVSAYHKFLQQHLGVDNGITFSRAGYKGAGSFPLHWAGDQTSEFSELRSQLKAGLSAGLSGVFFWGFDLAGFAGDLPTTELYLRATAMAAFCPIMQFHSEPRTGQFGDANRRSYINDRSPWNMAEVNVDLSNLEVYRYYANLRMNLLPYIYNEAQNSIAECRPLFCHLIYDNAEDSNVYDIEDEYMFGSKLLIAPVVNEGELERTVYLPVGVWYNFFTHERYEGGRSYIMACELGKILVFAKEGSVIPLNLSEKHSLGNYVGNNLDYDHLCFVVYGENGNYIYKDEFGNNLNIVYSEGNASIEGERVFENIVVLTSLDENSVTN